MVMTILANMAEIDRVTLVHVITYAMSSDNNFSSDNSSNFDRVITLRHKNSSIYEE
jgi:hypothetical protein